MPVPLRLALVVVLSIGLPAAWYVGARAWFESGSGFWYSVFFPQSALVFVWPALAVVAAWWLLAPGPRLSVLNLLLLPAVVVGGMAAGLFLGFGISCEYMSKCM